MPRKTQSVTLIPLRLPIVKVGDDLTGLISKILRERGLHLKKGDVVAVASKVVSTSEGQIVQLRVVPVSRRAEQISKRWEIEKRLSQIVLNEADDVIGGVRGFALTIKNGILTANAGVDLKNGPRETAILWPKDADESATRIRRGLEERFGVRVGVELVDSRVTPLRLGTTGLAIGVSGFLPVIDHRGRRDLYGRKIRVTQTNVGDDLAAAAHFMMGESGERVGAVVVRNAEIHTGCGFSPRVMKLAHERCLIGSNLRLPHSHS